MYESLGPSGGVFVRFDIWSNLIYEPTGISFVVFAAGSMRVLLRNGCRKMKKICCIHFITVIIIKKYKSTFKRQLYFPWDIKKEAKWNTNKKFNFFYGIEKHKIKKENRFSLQLRGWIKYKIYFFNELFENYYLPKLY